MYFPVLNTIKTLLEDVIYFVQSMSGSLSIAPKTDDLHRDDEKERLRVEIRDLQNALASTNSEKEVLTRAQNEELGTVRGELTQLRQRFATQEQRHTEDLEQTRAKVKSENLTIIEELKKQIEEVRREKDEVARNMQKHNKDATAYTSYIEEVESQLRERELDLNSMKSKIEELENQITALQQEKHTSMEEHLTKLNDCHTETMTLQTQLADKSQQITKLEEYVKIVLYPCEVSLAVS